MPRQARIDIPGALDDIIVRGIERGRIFQNDQDRIRFVDRLGTILSETATSCYAWVLLPNHLHLLLRTDRVPIATVMRRLLTSYAVTYNRYIHLHPQGKNVCYWVVRELGMHATELARRFRMTQPAVSILVKREESLANAKPLKLLDE